MRSALGSVATVVLSLAASVLVAGCESAEESTQAEAPGSPGVAAEPLAARLTATCEEATSSRPEARRRGWRRDATTAGPVAFAGYQRFFAERGDATDEGPVKIPILLGGSKRVVIAVARGDRDRATISYNGTDKAPRVALEGCSENSVTFFAGGFLLANHSRPVELRVLVEGESGPRRVVVGTRT